MLFLSGFISCAFLVGLWYALRSSRCPIIGRNRLTFITKNGEHVYDRGVPGKTGFTLTKQKIEEAEDVFIDVCWKTFGAQAIRDSFSATSISFRFFPFPHRDTRSGFAEAATYNGAIQLGLTPFVDRGGLAHEWMHEMLRKKMGHPDKKHTLGEFWESGLVGQVNNRLFALRW